MTTPNETQIADNAENTRNPRRRASDDIDAQTDVPQARGSLWRWLINGITVGGVISAIFFSGRASHSLDSTVKKVDRHDVYIVKMMEKQTELMLAISDNTNHYKKNSEFMDKFFDQQEKSDNEFKEIIKEIRNGVLNNTKDIIILQQKNTALDKLSVYQLAMVAP